MSRADKRVHRERVIGTSKDESVRIFAFANTRPTYHVVFSPEQPIIILKSKKSATAAEQHPCAQWAPFSDLVFTQRPNTTHAVYVADTTALSMKPGLEQEELVSGPRAGGTLKQLGNAVARLNPHNAVLVAAGQSAHLALKYMLVGEKTLGHRDRLVERLVLVCPSSLDELSHLTDAVARMQGKSDYPKPSLTVLVKGGADVAAAYQAWLSGCTSLLASSSVETDLTPSLFAAVARHALARDGNPAGAEGPVDTNSRYEEPRVYRIDFVLSKASKNVEQFPVLSPLNTLGVDDEGEGTDEDEDYENDDDDEADDQTAGKTMASRTHHEHAHEHHHGDGDCGSCCGSEAGEEEDDLGGGWMYVSGVSALQLWKEPVRIMLEGRLLDLKRGLVGTTEGCVTVEGLADMVAADEALSRLVEEKQRKKKGSVCLALATRLLRDAYGRTTLRALEVCAMTRQEEKRSMTVGDSPAEIPAGYNVSSIAHSYGAIFIRGRKCVLVRDLEQDKTPQDLFLPHQPLVDHMESGLDCAIRALCEACDISSDSLYCPSYLAPIVYYTQEEDETGASLTRCVTLYIALAVNAPPRGPASDAKEDPLDPTDLYDWVGYHRALTLLTSAEERGALGQAVQALQRARQIGLYSTFPGCGFFGDAVAGDGSGAAGAAGAAGAVATSCPSATNATSLAPVVSLDGTVEMVVVLCPGNRLLPDALDAAIRSTLGVSDILTYDSDSDPATLSAAAEDAVRAGRPLVAVFVCQEDVDVDDFCAEQLFDLLEQRGLRSRLVTVVTPALCATLADMAASAYNRAELMQQVLSAARLSDVLSVAVSPPFTAGVLGSAATSPAAAERALWSVLACCTDANPDLTLLRGWQASSAGASSSQRISVEEIQSHMANSADPSAADPSTLRHVRIAFSEASKPLAPAALHYLTTPSSLDVFYQQGESLLLSLEGIAWVATRPEVQGLVSLDATTRCVQVEGGDVWEETEEKVPQTVLRLDALCASAEAEAKVRATAAVMFRQLVWDAARDGDDVTALKDPLPAWDE